MCEVLKIRRTGGEIEDLRRRRRGPNPKKEEIKGAKKKVRMGSKNKGTIDLKVNGKIEEME